jgi:diguanylate cyclase (GGDEF)-like protein
MRQLAIFGLVASLLLGSVAVFETSDSVNSRRAAQDRALQAAVDTQVTMLAGNQRQTLAAMSMMLVDPAVRQLLSAPSLSAAARRSDVENTAASLAAVQSTSGVPLIAACLDDAAGRQLVCVPRSRSAVFPLALTRGFAALAARSAAGEGIGSAPFRSPIDGRQSVAFIVPLRLGGRSLGLVHLDMSTLSTPSANVLVSDVPHVTLQLGSYASGRLTIGGPPPGAGAPPPGAGGLPRGAGVPPPGAGAPPPGAIGPPPGTSGPPPAAGGLPRGPGARPGGRARTMFLSDQQLDGRPQPAVNAGHRALVAVLPMLIGGAYRRLAVVATETHSDPNLLNSWSAGLLTVLITAVLGLLGSIAGLAIANRRVQRELSTDALTGLRNRRALLEELPRVCQRASEEQPAYVWFFDLNGFKRYNDSFGHLAGDSLLARLGGRLRRVIEPYGDVYRLGGDEFCALITAPIEDPHALFVSAREALGEQGGAFAVSAAAGAVEIPRETKEPMHALRLADQHMYREKATGRGGAAELITAVLHAALAQRHPDLGEHSDDVAGDVELLARTIGLDEEIVGLIIKAGDLHDVGKLGIPDEILTKPGALSEQEWTFMKQHTVMGEQIIAAAGPSLERIGPLVRASHERWDGHGYPDGLAGEEIPLGARIITICDSFRAMLDERSYKPAMSIHDALWELRRCAGTQFDPQLVEVFCRIVSERAGDALSTGAPLPAAPPVPAAAHPATAPRPAELQLADRRRSSAAAGSPPAAR